MRRNTGKKIFVPKTCRVGFQEREDTFAKKLAYVIYYGPRGDLRKETSWKSWCHKPDEKIHAGYDREKEEYIYRTPDVDVTPYDFDNVPTSGFVLNKGHTRYSWDHFGGKTSVVRIYDPRGIEFEISPENLVGILMHTDCSRREIQGDLVYAFSGGDLMLLPCSSEEYKEAMNYTSLQTKKVSARDLQEGYTYVTKSEEELIYVGRHTWHEVVNEYDDVKKARVGKKYHIFYDPNWEGDRKWNTKPKFKPIKSVASRISACVSASCHDDYANLVDQYLASPESAKIVDWKKTPISAKLWQKALEYSDHYVRSEGVNAVMESGNDFVSVSLVRYTGYRRGSFWAREQPKPIEPPKLGYVLGRKIAKDGSSDWHCYGHTDSQVVTDKSKFFRLTAVFDNGLKMDWSTL